jgi:hypothetical protein
MNIYTTYLYNVLTCMHMLAFVVTYALHCTELELNWQLRWQWPSDGVSALVWTVSWTLDKAVGGQAECEQPGWPAALPWLLTFSLAIHCLFLSAAGSRISDVPGHCHVRDLKLTERRQRNRCDWTENVLYAKHYYSVGVNTFGTVRPTAVMTAGYIGLCPASCSEW